MEAKFLTSRYPILTPKAGQLSLPSELLKTFSKDFDMFRVVRTRSFYNAATYAFLEHLCRPLTSKEDFTRISKKFKQSLKKKLVYARSQLQKGQSPFPKLEEMVTKTEVKETSILNFTVFVHTSENGVLHKEVFSTFRQEKSLLVNVLSLGKTQVLLYTELMTFLDGYNPHTGKVEVNHVPSNLLKDVENEFYYFEDVKTAGCKNSFSFNQSTDGAVTPRVPEDDPSALVFPSVIMHEETVQPGFDDDHPDPIENDLPFKNIAHCDLADSCILSDRCTLL